MAWIYLAESAESVSHSESGCKLSHIVNKTDIAKAFLCQGCETVRLTAPPYGMTCERCGVNWSQASTSFLAASHVRILVLQEMESAWLESEADYFGKLKGSLKKLNRNLYFSKTYQQLELGASTLSCNHLPSSGMTVDGQLYQHKKLEPVTLENVGFYLPTPVVSQKSWDVQKNKSKTYSLSGMASRGLIPTPQARDWKGPTGKNRQSPNLPDMVGGPLNPRFVEEIMGYDLEWTKLKDWAIQWCQNKREKRLGACQVSLE